MPADSLAGENPARGTCPVATVAIQVRLSRPIPYSHRPGSPYLLAFVDQVRRTVDWKNHALQLATKLYGIEKAEQWKLKVEVAAPAQAITQVRVKPNPDYAANLASPPTKRPVVSIEMPSESLARSGD